MSAANNIPQANRQDDQADDGLGVPDFLKIPAAARRRAWERHPPKPMPAFGREMTSTEVAYRASIEREKAAKRAADETRFKAMRAKSAAEKAEREAITQAVKRKLKFAHPGRSRRGAAGRGSTEEGPDAETSSPEKSAE